MNITRSDAISMLALFVALGGTSYAVARNSIGTNHLKNDAVTSQKVRNGALTAEDLAPGATQGGSRGPRGAVGPGGPRGEMGTAGQAGPPGIAGTSTAHIVKGAITNVPATGNYAAALTVDCSQTEVATGGGVITSGDVQAFQHTYLLASRPLESAGVPTGWTASVRNDAARDGFPDAVVTVQPWVVCMTAR